MSNPTPPVPSVPSGDTGDPAAERRTAPDHTMLLTIHRGMRADVRRLREAVERLEPDDPDPARALLSWLTSFRGVFHMHHHTEDEIVFPALVERAGPRAAEVVARLDRDHHRLDELLDDVERHLVVLATASSGAGAALACLAADAAGLAHELCEHLDLEEEVVVPLLDEFFTADELASVESGAGREHRLRDLRFFVPWFLDHADPRDRDRIVAEAGPVMRFLERRWRSGYRRLDAALPAGSAVVEPPASRDASLPSVVAVLAVATIAVVALVLGGCGTESASSPASVAGSDAGTAHAAHGGTDPGGRSGTGRPTSELRITADDYSYELSSERVVAGPVTVTLSNHGSEPHQVHIAKLPAGQSVASFVRTFQEQGEQEAMTTVEWAGGVNGVEPGGEQRATSDLAPGRYALICFIPTPGHHGTAHLSKGMVHGLTVVDGPATPTPAAPPSEIVLSDFAIKVPAGFAGGPTTVRNDGAEAHELILMRLHDGASLADVVAWQQAGSPAERPFDYVGGVGTMEPGRTSIADLDLRTGSYVALCVVTGRAGMPHAQMGMVTPFTVA